MITTVSYWFPVYGSQRIANYLDGTWLRDNGYPGPPGYDVSGNPFGVAVDQIRQRVWVTTSNGLYQFDFQGNLLRSTWVGVDCSKNGIAIDKNGNGWLADSYGAITQFNGNNLSEMGYYDASEDNPDFRGIAIDQYGCVWACGYANDTIYKINPVDFSGTKYTNVSLTEPYGIAIDKNSVVWVTSGLPRLLGFNLNGVRVYSKAPNLGTGKRPYGVAVDGLGNIWATGKDSANFAKWNSAGTYVGTYTVPGICIDPVGISSDSQNNLWIVNATDYIFMVNQEGNLMYFDNAHTYYLGDSLGDFTGFAYQWFFKATEIAATECVAVEIH